MKLDKRVERNTQSVLALRDYLQAINSNPGGFLDEASLYKALQAQGALSVFSVQERGIVGSSLNTVKRIADTAVDGGFAALDRLRRGALEAIAAEKAKSQQSNKITRVGLAKRVKELELDNQLLRQDLLLLTLAFEKSLTQGRNYASKAEIPALLTLCKREQGELLDMFSLQTQRISARATDIHGR